MQSDLVNKRSDLVNRESDLVNRESDLVNRESDLVNCESDLVNCAFVVLIVLCFQLCILAQTAPHSYEYNIFNVSFQLGLGSFKHIVSFWGQ